MGDDRARNLMIAQTATNPWSGSAGQPHGRNQKSCHPEQARRAKNPCICKAKIRRFFAEFILSVIPWSFAPLRMTSEKLRMTGSKCLPKNGKLRPCNAKHKFLPLCWS